MGTGHVPVVAKAGLLLSASGPLLQIGSSVACKAAAPEQLLALVSWQQRHVMCRKEEGRRSFREGQWVGMGWISEALACTTSFSSCPTLFAAWTWTSKTAGVCPRRFIEDQAACCGVIKVFF